MSIATDEAARRWPDSQALQQPSMDDMYGAWSREAFVLGAAWQRWREPTEAEIDAALKALRSSLVERNAACRITLTGIAEISVGPTIAKLSDGTRLHLDRIVSIVLEAARKAVTK